MSAFIYPTDPQIIAETRGVHAVGARRRRGRAAAAVAPDARPAHGTAEQPFAASRAEEGRVIAFTVDFFGDSTYPFPYRR